MDNERLMARLATVFKNTFGERTEFRLDLVRDNVSAWDSLHHVMFFVNLENEFGIRFDEGQVASLRSIPEILEYLKDAV